MHPKTIVRKRRGKKLRAAEETLFNGDFWTGRKAQELGLIDGLADMRAVIQDNSQRGLTAQRGFPVEFSVRGPDWDRLVELGTLTIDKSSGEGQTRYSNRTGFFLPYRR